MFHRICHAVIAIVAFQAASTPYVFSQSRISNEKEAEAHRERGQSLLENGQPQRAVEAFTQSLRLHPEAAVFAERASAWYELEEYANAVADCDRVIQLNPATHVPYVIRGSSYNELQDFNHAIADLTIAADHAPADASVFLARAIVWANLGQDDLAFADWQRGVRIAPDNKLAHAGIAICWEARGDWNRAIAAWNRALELDPNWVEALVRRGKAHEENRDYASALADLERAVNLQPDSADATNQLGLFLATCPDERHRQYQRAIQLAAANCRATEGKDYAQLAILATTYAQAGRFDEAIRWQGEAHRVAPDDIREALQERLELYRKGKPYYPAKSATESTQREVRRLPRNTSR